MADNTNLPAASGKAATDEVSYSGDTAVVQLVRNVAVTGSEGSKTVEPLDERVVDTDKHRQVVVLGSPTTTAVVELSEGGALLVSQQGANGVQGITTTDDPITDAVPVTVGGVASAAAPTAVSADGDSVASWYLRNGAQATVVTAAGALIGGDATNGLDVDITRLPALVAGSAAIGKLAANSGVDIGDVDVTSSALPTGAATAAKQPALGTAGTSSADVLTVQGRASMTPLLVDGSATTQPVSGTVTANVGTGTQAVSGTVAVTGVATETTLAAASAKLPATLGQKTKAASMAVTLASDSDALVISGAVTASGTLAVTQSGTWDEVGINDSGNSLTVDAPVATPVFVRLSDGTSAIATLPVSGTFWQATQPVSGTVTANAGSGTQAVSIASLPALTTGSAAIGKLAANSGVDIGDVDVTSLPASTNTLEVVGDVAQDAAIAGNPVAAGWRASTVVPTAMSADGDVVYPWANRSGAPVVTAAPHVGLNSDPWNLQSKTAQYTTTQTSAVLQAGGASEKVVVTKVQIQVGGTTAGTMQLYFGTGAYSRGTNRAIFDGEFAPSATLKPGVIMDGPWISGTNGDDVLVTTSAAINPITVTIWFYLVT